MVGTDKDCRPSGGTVFARTLVRLRKDAGFRTAYRFYHDNGGAPVLKLSYRKYLSIEQGKILPVPGRLHTLIFALRILPKGPASTELVTAWLRTMAGEDTFREIIEPMLVVRPGTTFVSPMGKAMKKSLAGEKYYIRPSQLDVIAKSRDNYRCFILAVSDNGLWSNKEFAQITGLTPIATARALKSLASTKLIKRVKAGYYKCSLASKMVEYPQLNIGSREKIRQLMRYQEELISGGKSVFMRSGIIRADADALCNFYPLMDINLSAAHSYSVTEKTEKSAIFAVEGRITKLLDF